MHSALVALDVLPRYDALVLLPVAFGFAWLTREVRARTALALAFLFLVGGAAYAHQLSTGLEGRHALVGGVIPWSDAQGFLSNAWRAMFGLQFSQEVTGTAMRPLYPMTLAATLAIFGGNVKLATAFYASAAALLMGRCAGRMGHRYGWRAFAGVLVVLAWYLRRYLFVIGTESFGVLAGLCAFDLFATALEREGELRASRTLFAAFAILGVGLMARPGPFVAVLLLVLWLGRRAAHGQRWKVPLVCAAALALGIGFNTLVVRTTGERSGMTGGEFPPILYGAMHGEDFTYLAVQHPEVAALPVSERVGATARAIGGELAHRPWLALGFLRGAAAFAVDPHGLFSLVFYDPDDAYFEGRAPIGAKLAAAGPYRVANLVAMAAAAAAFVIFSWLGLRRARSGPRDLLGEAALVVLVGATLNACFTPPWITEGAQLQATTLPFLALLPWVYRGAPVPPARESLMAWAHAAFAVWVAVALVYVWTRPPGLPAGACGDGRRALHYEPSLFVQVTAPGEGGYTLDRMHENMRLLSKHNSNLTNQMKLAAAPGLGLEMVFDGCAGRAALLLVEPSADLKAKPRGWAWLDGEPNDEGKRIFRRSPPAP